MPGWNKALVLPPDRVCYFITIHELDPAPVARHPSIPYRSAWLAVRGTPGLCLLAGLAWTGLLIAGGRAGLWTLVTLTLFSAVAFLLGALVSILPHGPDLISRVDAAAAGSVLASALILVVPHALLEHAGTGALGLCIGLAIGLALHAASTGRDGRAILGALTLHSICDGIVLGALYTIAPTLGWGVGLAVLAHKTPTGYVLARRLADRPRQQILVVLPALGTGLGALCIAIMPDVLALPAGLIFGTAAGLFLFVALTFFASSAKTGTLDAVDWLIFGLGGTTIAVVGWIVPHGV